MEVVDDKIIEDELKSTEEVEKQTEEAKKEVITAPKVDTTLLVPYVGILHGLLFKVMGSSPPAEIVGELNKTGAEILGKYMPSLGGGVGKYSLEIGYVSLLGMAFFAKEKSKTEEKPQEEPQEEGF